MKEPQTISTKKKNNPAEKGATKAKEVEPIPNSRLEASCSGGEEDIDID